MIRQCIALAALAVGVSASAAPPADHPKTKMPVTPYHFTQRLALTPGMALDLDPTTVTAIKMKEGTVVGGVIRLIVFRGVNHQPTGKTIVTYVNAALASCGGDQVSIIGSAAYEHDGSLIYKASGAMLAALQVLHEKDATDYTYEALCAMKVEPVTKGPEAEQRYKEFWAEEADGV